jgi:hypothetical protein
MPIVIQRDGAYTTIDGSLTKLGTSSYRMARLFPLFKNYFTMYEFLFFSTLSNILLV